MAKAAVSPYAWGMIPKAIRIFPILVWAGLAAGCLTGTGTPNGAGGAGLQNPAVIGQGPGSAGAANGAPGSSDVMVASSDSSNAVGDQCVNLEKIKKEYAGTDLRIPDCYLSSVGWQSPNSQEPTPGPEPAVFFSGGKWKYPLTLTVQALYRKTNEPKAFTHEDFRQGPAVLFIFGGSVNGNGDIDWQSASICEAPLMAVTRDEGLEFANIRQNLDVWDDDKKLNVYLYYKPIANAASAVDYDPTTSIGTPAVPSSDPCKYRRRFDSFEQYNDLLSDLHVFGLGSFPLAIPSVVDMGTPESLPAEDDAPQVRLLGPDTQPSVIDMVRPPPIRMIK